MKTVKSKILLMITAIAMVVCLSFGLAACKGEKAFKAPENVTVTGDTLGWDEVENAENGYTVKINEDETTSVKQTSLDLTIVTGKLKSGKNMLAVKVNATDGKKESAYSKSVEYNYTPGTSVPEKTPFAKPTVTLSGDTVSWTAVDGATNGYTVKIGSATLTVTTNSLDLTSDEATAKLVKGNNTISVKVNAAGNHTESEYSDAVTYEYVISAETEAEGFISSVNAIGTVTSASTEAITTAKAKYAVLSEEAKAIAGVTEAITALKEKDGAYFGLLVTAVPTVEKTSTKAEFDGAGVAIEAAETYYGTLLDVTLASDAKATFDGKKTAYEGVIAEIKEDVNTLASEIDVLLSKDYTATNPVKGDYDGLVAKEEEVAALSEYAKSYWDETYSAKSSAITAKKAEILAIPVDAKTVKSESTAFINRDHGGKSEIYVIRQYINVLDEAIEAATVPNITIDGVEDENGEKVSYNASEKCYVYVVSFACPVDGGSTTVTYKIGSEEAVTKTVKYPSAIITYNLGTNKFIDGGKLVCYGVSGAPLYADVYAEDAITAVADHDIDISVNSAALATIRISNNSTEDTLKSLIARKGVLGENLKLRLVIYELTDDGVYSAINSCSVSETLTYTLTKDDVKVRLDMTSTALSLDQVGIVWGDGGLSEEFLTGLADKFNNAIPDGEEVTLQTVKDYIQYYVEVTYNGKTIDFNLPINMSIGQNQETQKWGGYSSVPISPIKEELYKAFDAVVDGKFTFKIGITLADRAVAAYGEYLRTSELVEKEVVYSVGNVKLTLNFVTEPTPETNVVKISDTTEPTGNFNYGRWEMVSQDEKGLHDGVTVFVYEVPDNFDAGVTVQTYDFIANAKYFAAYTHNAHSYIAWSDINNEISKVWAKLPAAQKTTEKQFVYVLQKLANENGKKAGYIDSDPVYVLNSEGTGRAVVTYNRNWTVPNGIQIGKDGAGNIIFLMGFALEEPMKQGYLSCVEIHFATQQNATEYYTAYIVCYKNDDDTYTFALRKALNDVTDEVKLVHGENEYWTGAGEVNTLFANLASSFDITQAGWWFQTQAKNNAQANYYVDGDGLSGWVTLVNA